MRRHESETFGVVVMTTGGNDVIHNYGRTPPREGAMYGVRVSEIGEWVENFERRLDTIVERLRETFPGGCHLFVANIYDPTDGDGDIQLAGLPAWPWLWKAGKRACAVRVCAGRAGRCVPSRGWMVSRVPRISDAGQG